MSFFNKEEDVIYIRLTEHGREKLAQGKWKPVYYAFHDDNVLYDTRYGGFSEEQNEAEGRIIAETQHLKEPVPAYESLPLGTSNLEDDDTGIGWTVNVLKGCVDSVVQAKTPDQVYKQNPRVVEINLCDVEFTTKEDEDGQVTLEEDYLLLELEEEGVDVTAEDYEVGLSFVSLESGSINVDAEFTRDLDNVLLFARPQPEIVDGMLVAVPRLKPLSIDSDGAEDLIVNSGMVDSYFDVATDNEIEEEILCAAKAKMINDGNVLVGAELDCPELVPAQELQPTSEEAAGASSMACPEGTPEGDTNAAQAEEKAQIDASNVAQADLPFASQPGDTQAPTESGLPLAAEDAPGGEVPSIDDQLSPEGDFNPSLTPPVSPETPETEDPEDLERL